MNRAYVDIIIVRGAPASGKSETAKCLAKYFPQGVRMEIDNLRSMVISVNWIDQQEHINILQISTKAIAEFLNLGFNPIIVIDTFSGDKVDKFLSDLYAINSNFKIAIFGLYATEKELTKRIKRRKEGKFNDIDICLKLNSDAQKFRHLSEIQIDTTENIPQETAQIIMSTLS